MENKRLKKAYKIAYKIDRAYNKFYPWDYSDYNKYIPDHLRIDTYRILNGDITEILAFLGSSHDTEYIIPELLDFHKWIL